jgi:hypothetical protein
MQETAGTHLFASVGAYGVPAMAWYGNVKPLLFEMSVPQFFVAGPRVLNRASDSEEGATTESSQKTECVLPNASQDHVKKVRDSHPREKGPRSGAEYLRKRNILVDIEFIFSFHFARGVLY